jgi:hypothetical protein
VSFDWRLVAKLAGELSNRADEASLRSAVSRAYYSAYCYAPDKAGLNTAGSGESHKIVHDFYRGRANPKLKDFGAHQLPALHRKRKLADYNEDEAIGSGQAKLSVIQANKIIEFLDTLKKEEIQR